MALVPSAPNIHQRVGGKNELLHVLEEGKHCLEEAEGRNGGWQWFASLSAFCAKEQIKTETAKRKNISIQKPSKTTELPWNQKLFFENISIIH